jgi:hypothetical protein
MREWIDLFETIDPHWREVSHYILSADPIERRETVQDILNAARLDGWAGQCFVAAYAINQVLFGGKGELVGSYNEALMNRDARFTGHVAVKFDGVYWDSDGRPKSIDDIESWGMVDSEDPDYNVTPEEAEIVKTKTFDEDTILNMARMRGDDPQPWEDQIARAVGQTFEFDINEAACVTVTEIENMPSQEYAVADHAKHFNGTPVWTDPNDPSITIKEARGSGQDMFAVFQGSEIIAVLVVEPFYLNPSIGQIKLTSVAEGWRQKGFIRRLITHYRQHVGKLCSDGANSPEAREMWKALIQKPAGLEVVLWDTRTNQKIRAKGLPETAIWDDEHTTVLLVEAIDLLGYGLGERILEEKLRYPHHQRWGGSPDPLNP